MPHPLAGKAVPPSDLIDIPRLISDYYLLEPDPLLPEHSISFGTSGHRGSALKRSFNQNHILAITQAVCDYRKEQNIQGSLFIGYDTHALSLPAFRSALEVLGANGVKVSIAGEESYTPTPLISRAILQANRNSDQKSDGVVITPSHNPPEDGGFKYNAIDGGPADTHITSWIQKRANWYIKNNLNGILRQSFEKSLKSSQLSIYDYVGEYVKRLGDIIDMEAIRHAKIRIGADPLGGTALVVYEMIREYWGIDITLINQHIDPSFSFMSLDHDGKIRMDCSSVWVMKPLESKIEDYDLIIANDTDADRHGIITKEGGLMPPNHYLSVAIGYLCEYRDWDISKRIGKTLVSSAMIERVANSFGREVYEVPVGFKWFVSGLVKGELAFGGEESAGASFLCQDGTPWATDKDGIIMTLLSAEIMAVTGKDPAKIYKEYEKCFGQSFYSRIDTPASKEIKAKLKALRLEDLDLKDLAGEKIEAIYTKAPGNNAPIGGVKIVTSSGWIAMRPSGTEDIYKIYAESFKSEEHLNLLQAQAQAFVNSLID